MKKLFVSVLALALLIWPLTNAPAAASTIHYADSVNWTNNGTVAMGRDNPNNALGAPDGQFLSLGLGGEATFGFSTLFSGSASVFEVTFGNRASYPESADIYVGLGSGPMTLVTSITNILGQTTFSFTGVWDTMKIVDTSPWVQGRDGFDLDAVGVAPVPLPAAGLLLFGSLVGLRLLRRRSPAPTV